jgi:hypothetical protein
MAPTVKTRVYLTVDTENSMGGAWDDVSKRPVPSERRIFCKIDGRDSGIGWICDELDQRGFRATFFCEVLASLVLGDADISSYLNYLIARGQDVQLHAHPVFYFYKKYLDAVSRGEIYDHSQTSDNLGRLPVDLQRQLLQLAYDIFVRLTGKRPVAYRAGGYNCSLETLTILANLGLLMDSSFNATYQGQGSFDGHDIALNIAQRIRGIWELPVTVARQSLPDPAIRTGLKPFEISSISTWEMCRMLEHASSSGVEDVVIMFHSFSAVKARDLQYTRIRPDRIVRYRFTALLDYLAQRSDRFIVTTFSETANDTSQLQGQHGGSVADLGFARPLARKLVQGANRFFWL